jgi:hypothetical protein
LFTVQDHFTHDVVNSTGHPCVWDHDTSHWPAESNYQKAFP